MVLYEGISTDSYAVSVGSGGDFTGACAYGGYLLFFKENCVHKIYGQMPSEYQAQMILLDGVQTNAEKTLTVMDGLLYYKSPNGVCVFDGVQPTLISKDAFGEKTYTEVVKFTEDSKTYICGPCAATIRGKYYINLYDASEEKWYIYSYDKSKGIWHKEDGFRGESAYTPSAGPTAVKHMVAVNGDIFGCYSSDDDGVQTGMSPLAVLLGYVLPTDEDSCEWYAETGLIEAVSPDSTYLNSLNVRLTLGIGSSIGFYIEYDSSGKWEHLATIQSTLTPKSFTLPLRPRRCDHFRMRFQGEGKTTIYSISRFTEKGSVLNGN